MHLSIGSLAKVGPFLGQVETLDETNIKDIFHHSRSNETMQIVLESIIFFGRIFFIFFYVSRIYKVLTFFSSDVGETVIGGPLPL